MIEDIYSFQINLILGAQGIGNWLLNPMRFFTFLGSEPFYLLIAPAFYWCLDAGLGLRLGIYLMTSLSLNSVFKLAFHAPRPYWYSLEIKALAAEPSFGLPSGHAQNAIAVWGGIANRLKKVWIWVIAILLMVCIGFSRIYLGVHFPTDVLAGWVIGGLWLFVLIRMEGSLLAWLREHNQMEKAAGALTISLLMILLSLLARYSLAGWQLPAIWEQNALKAFPDEPFSPLAMSGIVSNAGAFFGLAMGGILTWEGRGFQARGKAIHLALRYLLGVIGLALIYYGLGAIFPRGEYLMAYVLRYLRYGLVGLWITYLAPLVFIRLKLADPVSVD